MKRRALRPALLALTVAACGAPRAPEAPTPQVTVPAATAAPTAAPAAGRKGGAGGTTGPHGETASLEFGQLKIVSGEKGEQIVDPAELHPPSGDPALFAIRPTALLYRDDGTLLVGVGDGTVTALDGALRRRWSVGFRGAIVDITPAGEGLVAVTTENGVVALVSTAGQVRWERQVVDEIFSSAVVGPGGIVLAAGPRGVLGFSPAGDLVFSHASSLGERTEKAEEQLAVTADGAVSVKLLKFRLGDPHPPIPSLTPTFPLTYRKVLAGPIGPMMADGPAALLAIVPAKKGRYELVRLEDGRVTKRTLVPARAARSDSLSMETWKETSKPIKGHLWLDGLVPGPGNVPWILGRSMPLPRSEWSYRVGEVPGAMHILEYHEGVLRERGDLVKTLLESPILNNDDILASQDGPGRLVCFGRDVPHCAAFDGGHMEMLSPPGRVTSVARIGDSTWLIANGSVLRSHGKEFQEVATPRNEGINDVAGTSERDVWTTGGGTTALHHDGTRWTEVGVPASAGSLVARAPDDVWSRSGRVHWDGQRWSVVGGAPAANALVARARDDIWLSGPGGLWHGTAPGPAPVRLPATPAPAEDGAVPASPPLPLAAAETGYLVERARLDETGKVPLTTAVHVAAAPDGTLWVQDWNRSIEVDAAGKTTSVARGESGFSGRSFYPEAAGRGLFFVRADGNALNARDTIMRFDGGKATPDAVQLDRHDAVAVHGNGRGATWVVGTFASDSPYTTRGVREYELSAHALVRVDGGSFRPVLGLPSATFCDVAAAPDGGAWFAGALNPGPMGEGILFHARGRLGSEATVRYRAPATLLAVTAVGPDEAWAVGAAGTVVHVVKGAITRYALASGAWLRAVAASGPDDVWIGGDEGTLLHYDGRAWRPVAHPLGGHAAVTAIAAARGALWVVGPSGILRITKRS